ncbi:hypothetical protein [Pontivivens insulae]|uniref:Lipoprotein n=1 Tax=Pontivivens insulae TaxID=1639689 RepID=A0A2R8AB81_9RHOB|nr:hypothetical protein [Pontivivens insulae]RED11360.1 hypothetical protein DFR53_3396 [Pontivivens insulae]SPF29467.1 hypothetical protein POI8812_01777 [Pontivivens insulae]
MSALKFAAIAGFTLVAASSHAATCPADAPEGYQWLSGYVDEFRADGTISTWFTDSYAQHPDDVALRGLQAFFDAGGNVDEARALFQQRGGSDAAFDMAMACAGVE